jgi:hypothetical protein
LHAQNVTIEANGNPQGPDWFLVDNDPTKSYAPTMASLVNNVLAPDGLPVVYDNTTSFVGTAPGPIMGYDSFGVNQAATPANYLTTGLTATLANGAVFNSWESYNAYSFTPGGYTGNQGQVAQWLAIGGAAGVGNVQEPGANPSSVANEDQMFQMLLNGEPWAEAAWSSFRQIGFVNTVVGDPLMTWTRTAATPATVVATNLFYRGSVAYDVTNPSLPGYSNDNAIAIDKTAYLPGAGAATFASVSSYSLGINGIMVDISGSHGTLTGNDFTCKVGNNNSPSAWATTAPPTWVVMRPGAGVGGSDRVEVTWNNNAIQKEWLEITVKGNDALGGSDTNSGLASSYVFFYGSAPGDDGTLPDDATTFRTDANDEIDTRNHPATLTSNIPITNIYDFNRDGKVDSSDQIISRNNWMSNLSALVFLSVGTTGPFAPEASPAATSSAIPATTTMVSTSPTATPALGGSPNQATSGGTGMPPEPTSGSQTAAPTGAPLAQFVARLATTRTPTKLSEQSAAVDYLAHLGELDEQWLDSLLSDRTSD